MNNIDKFIEEWASVVREVNQSRMKSFIEKYRNNPNDIDYNEYNNLVSSFCDPITSKPEEFSGIDLYDPKIDKLLEDPESLIKYNIIQYNQIASEFNKIIQEIGY